MASTTAPRDRNGFEIALICALKVERDAVEALLEVDFKEEGRIYGKASQDRNAYTTGVLGGKPVVLGYPRGMGLLNAATVASDIRYSFKNIKICLVVGVIGGAPKTPEDIAISLGDVIISTVIIQYDFGRQYPDGFKRKIAVEDTLGRASPEIAKFVAYLSGDRVTRRLATKTSECSRRAFALLSLDKSAYPCSSAGHPFPSDYRHKHRDPQKCAVCSSCTEWDHPVCNEAAEASCNELGCNEGISSCSGTDSSEQSSGGDSLQSRPVYIHFGRVASASGVMKSGVHRDKLMASEQVIGFEMEGAGTWEQLPTVVVKSVCDYADSKAMQRYAAATAASCTKAILEVWDQSDQSPDGSLNTALTYLPSKNRKFIGRISELETLERKLFVAHECSKLAVVGLGGIGKTQVVLRFAHSVLEEHAEVSVFWVSALSAETFQRGFEETAHVLGIRTTSNGDEDVRRLVQRHLNAKAAGRWLLIVDNADDVEILYGTGDSEGLIDFLPESSLGSTIFTTRNDEIAQSLVGSDVIKMEKMGEQEATDLLERSLSRKELIGKKEITTELLEELDYLPLAITQAAAYMNVKNVSSVGYLDLLRSTEQNMVYVLSTEIRDNTRHKRAANAVATTWIVSFKQIMDRDRVAANLLGYISCIEWKAIPHSILPAVDPEAKMTDAIGVLCSFSFLSKEENGRMYSMHRLVHLAARVWIRQYGQPIDTVKMAIRHLADIFPSDSHTNRETWRQYLPHVARIKKDTSGKELGEKCPLYVHVGRCLLMDGKPMEAVSWIEETRQWAYTLAEDDIVRLALEHTLATAYHANGQAKEAIALLEHINRKEAVLPEDNLIRLASQHVLAISYHANGQVKEAIQLLEHNVKKAERMLAADHPSRLASQHALAVGYRAGGQAKEAIGLLEHVVRMEAVLAEDDPVRLASQHELAVAYHVNRRVEEAIRLLEYVLKIRKRVLAEGHPDQLASQHALAEAYLWNGQVNEAIKLLEHVVRNQEEVLTEDHPNRLTSQRSLMRAYEVASYLRAS